MDAAVARRDHPRSTARPERTPRPIRHDSTGALEHRHERAEIMQVMARFNDQVDEPARDQPEGMTIATPMLHFGDGPHAIECRELVSRKPIGAGRTQSSVGDPTAGPDPHRPIIEADAEHACRASGPLHGTQKY